MTVNSVGKSTSLRWEAFKTTLRLDVGAALKGGIEEKLKGVCAPDVLAKLNQVRDSSAMIEALNQQAEVCEPEPLIGEALIKQFNTDRREGEFSQLWPIIFSLVTLAMFAAFSYFGAITPGMLPLLLIPSFTGLITFALFYKNYLNVKKYLEGAEGIQRQVISPQTSDFVF